MKKAKLVGIVIAAAGILVLAAGCGGGGESGAYSVPSPTGQYQALQFTLTTDKQAYSPGETVNATLTITNTGSQALEYNSSGYGGLLVGRGGVGVWNSLLHVGATGGGLALGMYLSPGQTINLGAAQWNQTYDNGTAVTPGQYTLVGWTEDEFYDTANSDDVVNEPTSWFESNFGATATITVQ